MDENIRKLKELVDGSDNIVFFGGAGVSTESGIPDFRSVDGLYHQKFRYPPETMLSHTFFERHTGEFFDFYRAKMLALDAQPNAAHRKLARLAELVGLTGDSEADRANAFIDAISAMERRLGIPTGFTCIREQDLPRMAAWAAAEANPTYPVPVIYDRARFIRVLRQVMQ